MWTYSQSAGTMTNAAGEVIATGYSGNGASMNEPADEDTEDHGPLPQGNYAIGAASTHPVLGPVSMELTPDPANEMFGRSGFFIHGDNAALDHTASDGCIILPRAARETIAESGDVNLKVVSGSGG